MELSAVRWGTLDEGVKEGMNNHGKKLSRNGMMRYEHLINKLERSEDLKQ